ncbi:hypothetical protein KZO25_02620 [Halomonas sp. ANAO-440]|uniref:hypothetical protein n=1 Tax=Halomonas sp. ANAO-440 TaxID=2861360 RepID=UPI001CAA69F5|nr:hypothetical protein [Halomonas sp. ANAO-440]MBZ0329209.1 hypothetical protein [Halomonas sp. ANAO-440]
MTQAENERRGNVPPSNKRYFYRTYGLTIASQLELPELPKAEATSQPDVVVLTPGVAEKLEGATFRKGWLEMGDDRCQITIEGVARYRVEDGQRILLDRRVPREVDPVADPGDIRLFLLGSALGGLLHQRHWLPLHVSALKTPSGVWAFTGHSGAGKSTIGAWLHYTQNWPLVTDDVAVIKPHEDIPYLHPGPPRVKLWKDALAALGIQTEGLVRDLTREDKYHLMLNKGFQDHPSPLKALVMLERAEEGEAASLERIRGVEAFKSVMATLYRPEMGTEFNTAEQLMRESIKLAGKIRVYRFRRPWSLDQMNSSIEPLLHEIKQ